MAIALMIQSTGGKGTNATFGSATTTGNLLVCLIGTDYPSGTTVSDTNGNSYTWVGGAWYGGGQQWVGIWYCPNAVGGSSNKVTSNTHGYFNMDIAIAEFSCVATVSPLDKTNNDGQQHTSIYGSQQITTTVANECIVSVCIGHPPPRGRAAARTRRTTCTTTKLRAGTIRVAAWNTDSLLQSGRTKSLGSFSHRLTRQA